MTGRLRKPIKYFLFTLLAPLAAVMLMPLTALADDPDGPCDYTDPYSNCTAPLDTYIWLFAIITITATVFYLHRQKMQNNP